MKKIIFAVLILINVVVFASNDNWRNLVIAQFRDIAEPLFDHAEATKPQFDTFYTDMVEGFPIQMQAEKALMYAINRFAGSSDYIFENAEHWKGHINKTTKLSTLIDIALEAPLIETRMAGFELYLAENNLDKSEEQVDILLDKMLKNPERNAPWSMWAMAMIAARGVDRDRIFDELVYQTTNPNNEIRRWAVDSLAKFGGEEIVVPLLEIAQYDESPYIQERAFCGLAQSGTLNVNERYSALPGLLKIAQDSQSSQQTLDWVYQALKEISNIYNLENNSKVWAKKLSELELNESKVKLKKL
jgi:hypothetical protein